MDVNSYMGWTVNSVPYFCYVLHPLIVKVYTSVFLCMTTLPVPHFFFCYCASFPMVGILLGLLITSECLVSFQLPDRWKSL